jgi:glycerol uptake facilitator-like aquaporin
VAFRFLWRNLPVVALAASAIVTIGLVLVVRALMHNDDRRTTVFAVLVGLLLTVSPAILVLMGR